MPLTDTTIQATIDVVAPPGQADTIGLTTSAVGGRAHVARESYSIGTTLKVYSGVHLYSDEGAGGVILHGNTANPLIHARLMDPDNVNHGYIQAALIEGLRIYNDGSGPCITYLPFTGGQITAIIAARGGDDVSPILQQFQSEIRDCHLRTANGITIDFPLVTSTSPWTGVYCQAAKFTDLWAMAGLGNSFIRAYGTRNRISGLDVHGLVHGTNWVNGRPILDIDGSEWLFDNIIIEPTFGTGKNGYGLYLKGDYHRIRGLHTELHVTGGGTITNNTACVFDTCRDLQIDNLFIASSLSRHEFRGEGDAFIQCLDASGEEARVSDHIIKDDDFDLEIATIRCRFDPGQMSRLSMRRALQGSQSPGVTRHTTILPSTNITSGNRVRTSTGWTVAPSGVTLGTPTYPNARSISIPVTAGSGTVTVSTQTISGDVNVGRWEILPTGVVPVTYPQVGLAGEQPTRNRGSCGWSYLLPGTTQLRFLLTGVTNGMTLEINDVAAYHMEE